nr:ORF6N domain-containing protein [Bacilli bacterium]
MNDIIEEVNIENMIYEVRGVEVMLDSDLAKLYHVETRIFNQTVKRNIKRFPEEFMFQLKENEYVELRRNFISSQNVMTLKRPKSSPPYVFTEQGVAMLSGILRSDIAIEASIKIIKAFVKMRHYINYNKEILPHRFMLLEDRVDNNTKRIDELFDKFNSKDITKNYIFFKDEFYDAYSVIMDIFNKAEKEIIIIDNYASKILLDMLRNIEKKIVIVSSNIDNKLKIKYESQYNNVEFIYNDTFHDRYIIIDRTYLYTSGSSLKDIGKKCFAINEIDDIGYLDKILEIININ